MAVEINGDEHRYPHFKDGQVLTHNDLNLLRDFLYSKSAFHARALLGFGVGCGLEGSRTGSVIAFTGGFALAQRGIELIADATSFDLAATPLDAAAYPFIDPAQGGRTAILRPAETVTAAGGVCGAAGCTTHTEQHLQRAEIVWVAGRLTLSSLEGHSALALRPVNPADDPGLTGFAALRNGLSAELDGLVEPATRALLDNLKLVGPSGIDLLKVGIVNEVLYALWDHLACKLVLSAPCLGETGEPAVALGHASLNGGEWTWDQRYRHHFRLSRALRRAIDGTAGRDLCQRYLDHIRAVLRDFTPPTIPAQPKDVSPGDIEIKSWLDFYEFAKFPLTIAKGFKWGYPPKFFQEEKPVFINPLFDPVYDRPMDLGIFGGMPALTSEILIGFDGNAMQAELERILGGDVDISVMTEAEFMGMGADRPVMTPIAGVTDKISLLVNGAGAIVGMATQPGPSLTGVFGASRDAAAALAQSAAMTGVLDQLGEQIAAHEVAIGNAIESMSAIRTEFMGELEAHAIALRREVVDIESALPSPDKIIRAAELADAYGDMRIEMRDIKTRVEVSTGMGIPVTGEKANAVNRAYITVLDAMLDAVERSATSRQVAKVREQIDSVAPAYRVVKDAVDSGELVMHAQPEAMLELIAGLSEAVVAAGLDRNSTEYVDLEQSRIMLERTMRGGGLG